MLIELHLRNLGVIGEAAVAFAPGLNVVTGETGAGKTLLITSLQLVTGARGSARLVAQGAAEASVEAIVRPPRSSAEALAELGSDGGDEAVLARRIGSDGRTRCWLDGRLVPLTALARLGEGLIELHSQGSGFALARERTQLEAVDALAGNDDLLARYRDALARMRAVARERAALEEREGADRREADLLAYQADEIERADLRPDEDELVAAELTKLEHAERLRGAAAEAANLAGPDGGAGSLVEAHRALESLAAIDPGLVPLAARIGSAAMEAADCARDLRAYADGLEADAMRLEQLQERKALLGSLKRKYGGAIEDVIAAGADARRRLQALDGATGRLAELGAAEAAARDEVEALSDRLSAQRRKAARKLSKLVAAELPTLALPGAAFHVDCTASGELTEDGRDRVAFSFSDSKERPPQPIGKVASGGELARAMIAVTLSLARAHAVPILVFDEADQGIGGEAALELARRLSRLGRSHQVLVVSHLPQIAAFADRHIAVRKTADDVRIEVVEESDRLAEISRMLAGLGSSGRARAHAAELVELAERERAGRAPPTPSLGRRAVG